MKIKAIFISVMLGLLSLNIFAQTNNSIGDYVAPSYHGGLKAFYEYLNKSISYPPIQRENREEGNVILKLFINSTGLVDSFTVRGRNTNFNNVVMKAMSNIPKWNPGTLNGQPIDTTFIQRIYFSLNFSQIDLDSTKYECINYAIGLAGNKKQQIDSISRSKLLYEDGVFELDNRNYLSAIDNFDRAEKFGFKGIDLYFNRGIANFRNKNMIDACRDWNKAANMGDKEAIELLKVKCN